MKNQIISTEQFLQGNYVTPPNREYIQQDRSSQQQLFTKIRTQRDESFVIMSGQQEEQNEDDQDRILFEVPIQRTLEYFKEMQQDDDLLSGSGFCLNFSLFQRERKRQNSPGFLTRIFQNVSRKLWTPKREDKQSKRGNMTLLITRNPEMKPIFEQLRKVMILTRQKCQIYDKFQEPPSANQVNQFNRPSFCSTIDTDNRTDCMSSGQISQNSPDSLLIQATAFSAEGKRHKEQQAIDQDFIDIRRSAFNNKQERYSHQCIVYIRTQKKKSFVPYKLRSHTRKMKNLQLQNDYFKEINQITDEVIALCDEQIGLSKEEEDMFDFISDHNRYQRIKRFN